VRGGDNRTGELPSYVDLEARAPRRRIPEPGRSGPRDASRDGEAKLHNNRSMGERS
jgi:hypothetical protein